MTSQRRIRVLLMISSMRGGGSERQTLHLLRELDRQRFEPHLYLLERAGQLLSQVPDDVVVHQDTSHDQPVGPNYPGKILRRQSAGLTELIRQQSIDVIYDRTFHMSMIAGTAASKLGVPRVSTIVSPPHLAVAMVESRFVWLKRRRLSKAYRSAFRVISVSEQAAQSAVKFYGLLPEQITVVPNPVPDLSFDSTFRLPNNDSTNTSLVCVGRMTAEKGHRQLIDALAMLENASEHSNDAATITVHCLGDGPLKESLEAHSKSLQRHRLVFHGHRDKPNDWIAAADGLVLPSIFEGMPNVVLEAMKLGTPVIATRSGGTVELQRDEPTAFWSDPDDARSLADAIDSLMQNASLRQSHAENAKKMVETFHHLPTATRQIESIFQAARDRSLTAQ